MKNKLIELLKNKSALIDLVLTLIVIANACTITVALVEIFDYNFIAGAIVFLGVSGLAFYLLLKYQDSLDKPTKV